MGKNKAREKKEFSKAERAAAASSKVIQRDQSILKRKASSQRELVSFNAIHYLEQSDVENLDVIRKSLIEKIRTVERVNERFQRDLRSVNSGLNSNRTKYALDELTKVQATLSLSSGYVTEAIDAHLLARPKIEAKKPTLKKT
ncbi:hypothetical protein H257_11928 [Aphanomyces astaci]|uniref:Uncharacterized protein n=1 Tax=Aphanomyces astaci TaxID=112090 RepID=W4G246_APHAT|nr:hypothetical protein H257_11928 [Aphanomyces astaci]ETV73104.1 hypothetical protein H257_11928 [Aphanomyces astaci]RQM20126.1 hypothetical protein B5M09_010841 [Aphanomyces astaci]|eukprot:XP_009837309.1 hypothetical protein H257_11928 [Aphanomyces astaci]